MYKATNIKHLWAKHKAALLYSVCLATLLFVLKWMELRFLVFNHALELYIGLIALLFTALGIWLALKLSRPKVQTVVIEKEVLVPAPAHFTPNKALIEQLEISKRELEILLLLAQGCSNQEIAGQLFVSLSTVKTHNQNLFEKLDVKRRTQAVEKAKRLKIIA
jgi:DNA-binding CsgD family transcriptional regulator